MTDLTIFDPDVVAQYRISTQDVARVKQYVRLLRGDSAPELQDIARGGEVGTRLLLNRLVELRWLLTRDPLLLERERHEVEKLIADQQEILERSRSLAEAALLGLIAKRKRPWETRKVIRYRLIEKYYPGEGWQVWGTLYENCSGMFPQVKVLIRAIPDDDRRTGRHLDRRIVELDIGIEDGERIVDPSYPIRFRVLPEIRTIEGASHHEVRTRLWEVIFEEMEKRRAERRVEYDAPEPTYVPLRERSEKED
ncbi:MAG: hypothetical protein DRI48_07560 [Chloroflexi bacterium]|nr:MAG: hypothetical protein DRI48_07560 [Chloroflexota bacterium]